ncbi:hypothetical protein [Longimicrobium sp.]|uniref:hypothetical protein n=1 Tax=Longimicrobium sp. TaxID=2029185 RepID=UPI003B3AD96E
MNKIVGFALLSLLTLSVAAPARAQDTLSAPVPVAEPAPARDTMAAPAAGPFRAEPVVQPQPAAPCVRQVRRIPPPPSPRGFRRQWPLAAMGSIVGWFIGDRIVGPKGNPVVILSGSTLGAIAGSHIQATGEGHGNLGRSVLGGVLGALPAGALLALNRADTYDEAEFATRGIIPVVGGSVQAAVTAGVTSSPLQTARIQIIECPHAG